MTVLFLISGTAECYHRLFSLISFSMPNPIRALVFVNSDVTQDTVFMWCHCRKHSKFKWQDIDTYRSGSLYRS